MRRVNLRCVHEFDVGMGRLSNSVILDTCICNCAEGLHISALIYVGYYMYDCTLCVDIETPI